MTHGPDAAELLRAQVQEVHRELNEGLTEYLRTLSPLAAPIGSRVVGLYLHAVVVEDITVQSLLRNIAPLYEAGWGGTGPAYYSIADLVPLHSYAAEVFASTESYLAALPPAELSRTPDLSRLGLGQPTIAWVVSKFVVLQLAQIYGELLTAVQQPR